METLWFWIAAIAVTAFVVLDGFDFGAGILHLSAARTDAERRQVLAAIGPFWDGNEVWLLASGGVLFLAFPRVLASGLSGFYLAIMLVLVASGLLLADHWEHLVSVHPSPGFSSERMELYLATGLREAPHRGEDFELHHEEADMTTSWIPVDDLLDGFLAGRLTDGPLGLAVMTYALRHRAR